MIAHFLSVELFLLLTFFGHGADWLLGTEQETHADWYFDGLRDMLEEYFSSSASNEAHSAVTADDVAAWASTADK